MRFRNSFPFILLLLLNISFIISKDYEFIIAHEGQVIFIKDNQPVIFNGSIEVKDLKGSKNIVAFTYSSEYIMEDENGKYINYVNSYELILGEEYTIPLREKYIIFTGNGSISFGKKINIVKLNTLLELTLQYEFNNLYCQMEGDGNKVEVKPYSDNIFINNINPRASAGASVSFNIKNGETIHIYNNENAKNAKIRLFFTYIKDKYALDIEKGEVAKYYHKSSIEYTMPSELSAKYFELREGILLVSGNPEKIYFKGSYSSNKRINSTHQLYYLDPYSESITPSVTTQNNEGEICLKGIKPTIVIDFPKVSKYDIKKGIGPQYFRINIDKNLNENYIFDFGTTVTWLEGTMFKNMVLNTGIEISTKYISIRDVGKTFTAVYNNDGMFSVKKSLFNWEELSQYEYKHFTLNPGQKGFYHYIQKETNSTLIRFEKGYKGTEVKIYIYESENDVKYDESKKAYLNAINEFSNWEEINIQISTVFIIIVANELYTDYISFRNKNIIIKNESPLYFRSFRDFNFIGFSLSLENENNIIEILSKSEELTISLYKNQTLIENCTQKACRFSVVKELNNEYFIYIKNTNAEIINDDKKLYILLYKKLEYYEISTDNISEKYFLLPFQYKFKLDSNLISNINLNKEFIINFENPSKYNYNIEISYNVEGPFKKIIEEHFQFNHSYYYFNLKNKTDISSLIITVEANWDINSFLPYEKINLAYGGPYLINIGESNIVKNIFNEYDIIYFKIKNDMNINKKYFFSFPSGTRLINGNIFKDNGELNKDYIEDKKYMLINELFENSDVITFEYTRINKAEFYCQLINEEILENKDYIQYKNYKLDFNSNDVIYYFGHYNQSIDTWAYINNSDQNIIIDYKNEKSSLFPFFSDNNINSNFFHLDTKYNIIRFKWNEKYPTKSMKEFTVFDPNLSEENFYYSKEGIFYVSSKLEKKIKLIIEEKDKDLEKNVYKVIIKNYLETPVYLNMNSSYEYTLNDKNNYTCVWEILKGEKFSFKAQANLDNLLVSKIVEGSVYKNLILNNNTEVNETANNILFKIHLLENATNFDIKIKNSKKTKFYFHLYKILIFNDINQKEKELKRLTLPILNSDSKESIYPDNSDTIKINYNNPYNNSDENDFEYYFALSYQHDLENPVENEFYSINIIYNEKSQRNDNNSSNNKNKALIIIIICSTGVFLIIILVLILYLCLGKKRSKKSEDYNISMAEDINIDDGNM